MMWPKRNESRYKYTSTPFIIHKHHHTQFCHLVCCYDEISITFLSLIKHRGLKATNPLPMASAGRGSISPRLTYNRVDR